MKASKHPKQRKYKPMLCSISKHDKVNQAYLTTTSTSTSTSTTSSSSYEEPSSPRVGCMGQVKINNYYNQSNNYCNTTSTSTSMVKYINFGLKARFFFSIRSLIINPTLAIRAAVAGAHKAETGRVRNIHININKDTQMELYPHPHPHPHPRPRNSTASRVVDNNTSNNYCIVNLKEMDPPLPVVKRALNYEEEEEERRLSLWKRRSGGIPLKSIQICQVNNMPS